MNFTTFIYSALVALGVFSFDAWYHGDDINLKIDVPKGYGASETSITDTVAENLFLNEVADIAAVPTFEVKPRVRSTNEATVVSMIGDLLGLKKVTLLIQEATGLEPLIINGSITKRNDRYQLVLASNPEAGLTKRLTQTIETATGESVVQMIRRAAHQAMLNYEDYLVCLYLVGKATTRELSIYEPSFDRPGIEGLDLLIQQRMKVQPEGLAAIEAADQINQRKAMFTNLRGMLALAQSDINKASQFFEEALRIRSTFGIAALNLAFVFVHQDRYQESIDLIRHSVETGVIKDPALLGSAYTIWGMAAWGLEHFKDAESQFKKANDANSKTVMANFYWSEMLDVLGNKPEAAVKRHAFIENSKFFSPYAETAIFFFRLIPNDKAPLTRL